MDSGQEPRAPILPDDVPKRTGCAIVRSVHLDHALIGNGRVLALVAPDTSIDWLCLPRFDSPSIFGRLLDEAKGGSWRIEAVGGIQSRQQYVRNTNVVTTTVETETGSFEVIDFAPWIDLGYQMDAPAQLIRLLIPVEGQPQFVVKLDPAPDFARTPAEFSMRTRAIDIRGHECDLAIYSDVPIDFILNQHPVRLDRPRFIALCADGQLNSTERAVHLRDQTVWSWINWVKNLSVPDFWPQAVVRSALCLKLHQYAPTGAIIAAATTSIPEELGSDRTWDYRYCWLRDSALVVEALRRLGCIAEGERFLLYLRDVASTGPLQPVYGVGGERDLKESFLQHLSGFESSGPVRIGNAAVNQVQLDLMGELLLSMRALLNDARTGVTPEFFWDVIEHLVNEARASLFKPDMGIWEKRSEPAVHTFSQALCWSALVNGAALARAVGRRELEEKWQTEADTAQREILGRAFNEREGMFTDILEGHFADAALLLLPMVGIISAQSPEFRSTLDRYREELVVNGLMKRYRHADDFGVPHSAFTICSFWWAEALALAGELDEAEKVFEHLLGFSNSHGLYSEDIDPRSGRMLGNFPQAYTHVGLINAAITIGLLKAARDGKIAPWHF